MILYPDCGYFHEERDDGISPYPYECEACYKYEICLKSYNGNEKMRCSEKPNNSGLR